MKLIPSLEAIFGILENHALFIEDPERVLSLALGKRELVVPPKQKVDELRRKEYQNEILPKLLIKTFN